MGNVIPADWLPHCQMERVILHWSAGAYHPDQDDFEHYHLMIDRDGKISRGDHSIADNVSTADDDYAAHTRGCNTGSVGIAVCAMTGATQFPFHAGPCPVTREQWNQLILAAAELCRAYGIPAEQHRLLTHGEVQPILGIPQNGKWDLLQLPFETAGSPPHELRTRVQQILGGG